MNTITVATFNDAERAEVVKKKLEEAGITAELCDESRLQKLFFSKPKAQAKVRVSEEDFDRAKGVLQGVDPAEHLMDEAIVCPECGSSRIEYPQFTRKFAVPMLVEVFCMTGLGEKQFFCKDCQYTWSPELKVETERDALGWPRKEKTV